MSSTNNPQLAAFTRLETLSQHVASALARADKLLALALEDAAKHVTSGETTPLPGILQEDTIVELTVLKNELAGLHNYYSVQKSSFTAAIGEAQRQQQEKPVADVQTVMQQMRERTEQAAAAAVTAKAQETGSAPQKRRAMLSLDMEPAVIDGNLPSPVALNDAVRRPPQGENNLQRLFGNNSPLLELFAPAPWLPNGAGVITVGSEGFQWYKRTDPFQKSDAERAKLPSGFYAGETRPTCVLIRLHTCIVLWTFELNVNATGMLIYMAGISDTDPQQPRWFKPTDLTASFTRRLVTELEDEINKRRQGLEL